MTVSAQKTLSTPEELSEALEIFKSMGFSRIQLPGGTSKDKSFCSSAIIFLWNDEKKMFYLVCMPYNPVFHMAGDENGHNKKLGETPQQTMLREIQEETGLFVKESDLVYLSKSKIVVPDRYDKEKTHQKHYFLVKNFSGTLFDFDGPSRIDAETAAPVLIAAHLLKDCLFPGHKSAVREAAEVLGAEKKEAQWLFADLGF